MIAPGSGKEARALIGLIAFGFSIGAVAMLIMAGF